jgi:hypothetical protein
MFRARGEGSYKGFVVDQIFLQGKEKYRGWLWNAVKQQYAMAHGRCEVEVKWSNHPQGCHREKVNLFLWTCRGQWD